MWGKSSVFLFSGIMGIADQLLWNLLGFLYGLGMYVGRGFLGYV